MRGAAPSRDGGPERVSISCRREPEGKEPDRGRGIHMHAQRSGLAALIDD